MRSGVKVAVLLLVTLPMVAYVAGRLAAAPPEDEPRAPVILDGPASRSPTPGNGSGTGPNEGPNEGRDEGRDDVPVVNPTPTRVVGEGDAGDDGDTDDREPAPDGDDRTDDDRTTGGD